MGFSVRAKVTEHALLTANKPLRTVKVVGCLPAFGPVDTQYDGVACDTVSARVASRNVKRVL